jgi:hypothetical protein
MIYAICPDVGRLSLIVSAHSGRRSSRHCHFCVGIGCVVIDHAEDDVDETANLDPVQPEISLGERLWPGRHDASDTAPRTAARQRDADGFGSTTDRCGRRLRDALDPRSRTSRVLRAHSQVTGRLRRVRTASSSASMSANM